MLKRIVLMMVLALALGACGIGGSSPTVTPPPTSTARPEPTTRPTATEAAAVPTVEPTAATGGSTGAGTIPEPPNSKPYVQGEDPVVDAAITAMEAEFAKQSGAGLELGDLNFYISEASVDETVEFYETEMPNNGWLTGQTQDQDFGKVLAYVGSDLESVGLIGILDLTKTGSEGLIVFTTTGKATTGGGAVDLPTEEPASGSSDIPTDIADVPAPPSGELYEPGADATTDTFLTSFAKGFADNFNSQDAIELKGQEEYLTTASQEEIKAFYDEELQKLGWTTTESTPNPTAQILNYTRINGANVEVAVIASLPRSSFSPSNTDTLVVIVVAGSK